LKILTEPNLEDVITFRLSPADVIIIIIITM